MGAAYLGLRFSFAWANGFTFAHAVGVFRAWVRCVFARPTSLRSMSARCRSGKSTFGYLSAAK